MSERGQWSKDRDLSARWALQLNCYAVLLHMCCCCVNMRVAIVSYVRFAVLICLVVQRPGLHSAKTSEAIRVFVCEYVCVCVFRLFVVYV